jgi:hypothetical protein
MPCFAMACFLWIGILMPEKFLYGVKSTPGGFDFRSPLRGTKLIRFASIRRIDAFSIRDGDTGESAVDLMVRTDDTSARIEEWLLLESGLLADLKALPGFDAAAYEAALRHRPSEFKEPFGKRFRVFDVAQRSRNPACPPST